MNKIDGRYLRDLREKHGYSLREFAQMIYVSKSSVQRWEKSSVPEYEDVLTKISEIFNISVDEMRRQSEINYGKSEVTESEKDELTPEQLTELKFGVKQLIVPVAFLFAISIAVLLIIFL